MREMYNSKSGDNILTIAAKNGNLSDLKTALELNNFNIEYQNFDGKSALHQASLYGHYDCVKYLISKNANINCLKRADW